MKNNKKYIYLVQTEYDLPEAYKYLNKQNSDLIYLTWREGLENVPFYPDSTWAEGRNCLLDMAKERREDYQYYIFIDDDLSLTNENIDQFEMLLERYRPAIATPRLWNYNENCENLSEQAHSVYAFDAAMNAYHHTVVYDDILFPYITEFDNESWWYSQLILIHKAHVFYDRYVLQFNDVHLTNKTHNSYPQQTQFSKIESWLTDNIFSENISILHHPDETRSFKGYKPKEPLSTYRIAEELKRKLLKNYV